ncbi:hypothetical protein [uncultured Fusobacterium sp.]|uniref:hypothetical protein n=1 Tax=uncultured Fusobacterium sp. TaxID=159267 RepID=UPI0026056E8F|nr:hypothetical protein [uncultured Fusobacterium sp.]
MEINVRVTIELGNTVKEFLEMLMSTKATNIIEKKTEEFPCTPASKIGKKEVLASKDTEKIISKEFDPMLKVEAVEDKKVEAGTIPVTVKTYTLQELGNAAKIVMDNGKREDLVELLASFGVKALTQLDTSKYNEFANKLRELGGDI